MPLTNVLKFRSGLGKLFLLGLGKLASIRLIASAALVGLASNLLPSTGVIHGGRRHVPLDVLVGFLASQVVALFHSFSQAKSDVLFMFPVRCPVKVRSGFGSAKL